jgi:tRNA-2-methylthio-N6-dimethylallyladenosine synthase
MQRKVYIKTYGCQMNERDSEAVAAMLRARGYALASTEADADVVLLNTCSVRDMAEQKAVGKMGMLAFEKKQRPELVLGFMGCMAQSRGGELVDSQPAVDLVVGTQRAHHIPDHLDRIFAERDRADREELSRPFRIVDTAEEPGSQSAIKDHVVGRNGDRQVSAFVSIQQGCDMHCAFCIVPYTRGDERSRSIGEIVDEVRALADQGVKEVTLLGQIVTSFGRLEIGRQDGKTAFVRLIEAVHEVPGIERIRFTSPHPKGFGDDLVSAYRDLPKLCEHAHLPVQSGSDRVLKLMKRGYSRDWYLRVVDKLRAARPGIGITTDFIVGFPGETDEEFEQTMSLARAVDFDQAYIFRYSIRRDTPAAGMEGQVDEAVKHERHQALLGLINESAFRKNQALVGQTVEILVEGRSERNAARMTGRTRSNKIVVFDGDDRHRGMLMPVKVERTTVVALYATAAIHGMEEQTA